MVRSVLNDAEWLDQWLKRDFLDVLVLIREEVGKFFSLLAKSVEKRMK